MKLLLIKDHDVHFEGKTASDQLQLVKPMNRKPHLHNVILYFINIISNRYLNWSDIKKQGFSSMTVQVPQLTTSNLMSKVTTDLPS